MTERKQLRENLVWGILTLICLLTAVASFGRLPAEIPVQWSNGEASTLVDKTFIFAYPAACVMIRFLLRPFIWRWLRIHAADSCRFADYVSGWLCFVVMSVEIFTLLFLAGIMTQIMTVLLADVIVLIGILLLVWLGNRNAGVHAAGR